MMGLGEATEHRVRLSRNGSDSPGVCDSAGVRGGWQRPHGLVRDKRGIHPAV